MKKFFTLVLMLFASLQLFANAEIVIYNNSTGTTVTSASDFTISSNNFKNIVEEGDNIVVTVSAYTRTSDKYPYFQIQWGTWEGWENSGIGDLSSGENAIPLTAADVTKINASTTYGINFRTNGTTSYTITKVVLRKNDSYADLETVTLNENTYNEGTQYQKVYSSNDAALRMSDGDLLVVVGTSDANAEGSWSMRELSTWDNVYSTGSFDGRDYAYIVASGKGSRIHADGFQFVTNKQMSAVKIAKKIYSLSETSDFDFSSVVTGSPVNVKLTRSITAGNWSTIVLPFDLTAAQVTSTFGTNVKVAELASGDTEKLTFNTVTTMNANKPYAILISLTDFPSNFSEATINGVTIVSGTPTQDIPNWDFVGTYTDDHIPTGSYFFQNNQLFYAETSGNHIKPFRAYFRSDGVGVRGFVGFSVDGQTTGIHSTLYDSTNKGDGKIYSLSGQIVTAPQKGVVYIVDGKKVIFNK